jgi:hypothetical protein
MVREYSKMGKLTKGQMGALYPISTTFVYTCNYFKIKCLKGDSYSTCCFLLKHGNFKIF